MSSGVPLLATTGGALPEVAGTHGETCFLVPPGDSEAMAAMMRRALDDAALARRVGAAGRQRVDRQLELAAHRRERRSSSIGGCSPTDER